MKKKIVFIILIVILVIDVFLLVLLFNKNREEKKQKNNEFLTEESIDTTLVEKYIRDNIKTLAINKSGLGDSWYVTSIFVFDELKSGIVTYEDGHIKKNAFFEYTIDENSKNIIIKKFEIKE